MNINETLQRINELAKKKKEEGPGTVSLKRMSTRAAFVFKSGCKGKDFKA